MSRNKVPFTQFETKAKTDAVISLYITVERKYSLTKVATGHSGLRRTQMDHKGPNGAQLNFSDQRRYSEQLIHLHRKFKNANQEQKMGQWSFEKGPILVGFKLVHLGDIATGLSKE